jgi:hypothetical protein
VTIKEEIMLPGRKTDSELSRLAVAAKAVMIEIDEATKSGNPRRLGNAQAEMKVIERRLDQAEVDDVRLKAVKATMRAPTKLGR